MSTWWKTISFIFDATKCSKSCGLNGGKGISKVNSVLNILPGLFSKSVFFVCANGKKCLPP